MEIQKILVPFNHTIYDEKALDFLIFAFSNREDTRVTLFNTYTPLPEIKMDSNPELAKLKGGMISLQEEIQEREAGLKSTKEHLLENGFADDQVDCVFKKREKSIPDEIADMVYSKHYRVVILSGKGTGWVNRLFSRSVRERIMSTLKDVTICIAR
jgi:hypothetical protein